jgi:hypothetical protein
VILPLVALVAAQAAQAQPSMIVSPEQFASALAVCRDQIGRAHFGPEELAARGWPKVISRPSDGTAPAIAVYRHPENMLLLGFWDAPNGPDECIIMAPTGPTLDMDRARASISALPGAKPAQRSGPTAWQLDAANVRLEPMSNNVGVRVIFAQKEAK